MAEVQLTPEAAEQFDQLPSVQTLTVAGRKFALVPFEDYRQLLKGARPDESCISIKYSK
jgi:hypothetical protein